MGKKDGRNHVIFLLTAGILFTAAESISCGKVTITPAEEREGSHTEEQGLKFAELLNLPEAEKSKENTSQESAGLLNLFEAIRNGENIPEEKTGEDDSEENTAVFHFFTESTGNYPDHRIEENNTEEGFEEESEKACEETEILPEDNYPNVWENTGNQAEDIAEVAKTQIGNRETEEQYTKYASWYYGRALSASWNAIFVSWCADQAGIPDYIICRNASSGCNKRIIDKNPFNCPAYLFGTVTPEVGDIAFIDDNSDAFSEKVGIITAVDYDWITVVMGDYDNQVSSVNYIAGSGEKTDESGNGTGEVIMFIARPAYE